MSQNNNNDVLSGIALALAGFVVLAYIAFAILAILAILAFIAFVFTILCLCAWSSPMTIGNWTLTPMEARSFVRRGIFGATVLSLFCLFIDLVQ
jgi:hypothetical protein